MKRTSDFSKRIKEYREKNNLTLSDMEKITGIPAQTINRYELGKRTPKVDMASKIAEALHVDSLWLQGYDVDINRLIGKDKSEDDDPDAPYQLVGHGLTGGERLVDTPKHAKISEIRFYLEQLDEAQLETVLQFVKFTAEQK